MKPQPTTLSTTQSPLLTVFYDGACPLCRAEIGIYKNCEGVDRVAFVDVADAAAGTVAPGLDRAAALARFHVKHADGRLVSGAAGFADLWSALPGWQRLGRLMRIPGILIIAEYTYRGFLHVRPAIQWIARRRS